MNTGQTTGHYTILRPLGKGGMGEVYLAEDTRLRREVAIKVLPESVSKDPDRLKRFRREAEAAAKLKHPNIATIHALEEFDGVLFIVMEYVKGQTLSAHIPSDGMDQAISGQRPFKGENTESIIGRILTEEPKAVTELKPVTPYILWVLIRQCIKKDSTQRMQTARRLHTAHVDVQREVQAGTVLVDAKALPPPPEPNAAFRPSHSVLLLAIRAPYRPSRCLAPQTWTAATLTRPIQW